MQEIIKILIFYLYCFHCIGISVSKEVGDFMKLGARIFKTALAVILAFYISEWLKLDSALFAAIASVLAVQPSLHRSFTYMKEQVISNLIGAMFAIFGIFVFGQEPVVIGLIIIVVIIVNINLKAQSSISLAVVTVIAIMGVENTDSLTFALHRFYSIMIGIFSAVIVNAFFIPPRYETSLLDKMKETHAKIAFLLKNTLNSELEEKVYKEEKEKVEEDLKKLQELYELYKEEYNNKYKKVRYSKVRKLVVCKQLLSSISVQAHALETMEKNFKSLRLSTDEMKLEIRSQIELLINFQEELFFKYEKKLKTHQSFERTEEAIEHNVSLLENVMKHFDNNTDEESKKLMISLFPVISSFIEWSNQLEHTDKLIDSLYSHHQEK